MFSFLFTLMLIKFKCWSETGSLISQLQMSIQSHGTSLFLRRSRKLSNIYNNGFAIGYAASQYRCLGSMLVVYTSESRVISIRGRTCIQKSTK